jgi:hypothetical protein
MIRLPGPEGWALLDDLRAERRTGRSASMLSIRSLRMTLAD